MTTKSTDIVKVKTLAKALNADIAWTGGLLTRLGIPIGDDGSAPGSNLRAVLDKLAPGKGGAKKVNVISREEMGVDQESCRQYLIRELSKHGITVIHREEKRNARFTLLLPSTRKVWLMSYVALKTKANAVQVGFTAGPGTSRVGDAVGWYAFISQPFGKIYLLSRRDLQERWTRLGKNGPLGRLSLSFSQGVDTNLFENRLEELLGLNSGARRIRESATRRSE